MGFLRDKNGKWVYVKNDDSTTVDQSVDESKDSSTSSTEENKNEVADVVDEALNEAKDSAAQKAIFNFAIGALLILLTVIVLIIQGNPQMNFILMRTEDFMKSAALSKETILSMEKEKLVAKINAKQREIFEAQKDLTKSIATSKTKEKAIDEQIIKLKAELQLIPKDKLEKALAKKEALYYKVKNLKFLLETQKRLHATRKRLEQLLSRLNTQDQTLEAKKNYLITQFDISSSLKNVKSIKDLKIDEEFLRKLDEDINKDMLKIDAKIDTKDELSDIDDQASASDGNLDVSDVVDDIYKDK